MILQTFQQVTTVGKYEVKPVITTTEAPTTMMMDATTTMMNATTVMMDNSTNMNTTTGIYYKEKFLNYEFRL